VPNVNVSRKPSSALPALAFTRNQWRVVTGLPVKTADYLVATGAIKSIKVGRRRLFRLADVEAWLARLARTGENPKPLERFLAHRRRLKAKAGAG
jgi:excisionase family DNA binding protein